MQTHNNDYLTPTAVAQLLEVATVTVISWANTGKLRCIKDSSGRRLFSMVDVEEFARNRRMRGGTGDGK